MPSKRSLLPAGTASASASGNAAGYDEERLDWGSASRSAIWAKKYLRFPRMRKVTLCLLVIDLIIFGLIVHVFQPLITLLNHNEELFGSRLTLPVRNPPHTEPRLEGNMIPRIFHQTSPTEKIPDKWAVAYKSCRKAYSDFEYKLWTDDSARDFIEAEYSWFLETWDNYPFSIQRADAIRYFVLYHYGGIYLDMDTSCNRAIPFDQIESDTDTHVAVFKSTKPTGVSNDLMITSRHHPLFIYILSRLLVYAKITRPWARLLPYGAILISAGPMFVTMAAKNYLLELPSLLTPTLQVINATELLPYITDLESGSWHHDDAQAIMYIGEHPWIWYTLGGIGLCAGLHIINRLLMLALKSLDKLPSTADGAKMAKLA